MKKTTTLKKNYEFKNVLDKGKRYSGKYIEIFVKKNRFKENKIGIAISSKIANSVNRNRIKRLIRENYKLIEEELDTGNCFVIIWKKSRSINEATFYNIKNDFERFIKNFLNKNEEG